MTRGHPVPEFSLPGFSFGRVRQVPHRALVNRAARRLGHPASIPRAIMSRSPEALALGPAVISFRRRYHCPSFGCLLNRSRDCTRSRVPPLSRRRYADPPAGASFSCLRFAPFGLPSLLRKKAALPRKPFSQRIYGVTVAGSGGIDPSRKSRSCPSPGRNEKPDLYAVASCTKGRSYVALPRYRTAAKDISDPLDRFALRPGCDPQAAISQSRDTTTSFSLKSSLPPSWWLPWRSSLPSSLSWPCRPL